MKAAAWPTPAWQTSHGKHQEVQGHMLIRSRMGVSLDGFVATPDGLPAWLAMADFAPGVWHGHPEFIEGYDAVVVGAARALGQSSGRSAARRAACVVR